MCWDAQEKGLTKAAETSEEKLMRHLAAALATIGNNSADPAIKEMVDEFVGIYHDYRRNGASALKALR